MTVLQIGSFLGDQTQITSAVPGNGQTNTRRKIRRGSVTYNAEQLGEKVRGFLGNLWEDRKKILKNAKNLKSAKKQSEKVPERFKYEGKIFTTEPVLSFGGCALHAALGRPNVDGVYQYPSQHPNKDNGEEGDVAVLESLYLAKCFHFQKLRQKVTIVDDRVVFLDLKLKRVYCACLADTFSDASIVRMMYSSEEGEGIFKRWKTIRDQKLSEKEEARRCESLYLELPVLENYEKVCCENSSYFFSDNEVALIAHVHEVCIQILRLSEQGGTEAGSQIYNQKREGIPPVYIYYDPLVAHFSACQPSIGDTPHAATSPPAPNDPPSTLPPATKNSDREESRSSIGDTPDATTSQSALSSDSTGVPHAATSPPAPNDPPSTLPPATKNSDREESPSFIERVLSYIGYLWNRFLALFTCTRPTVAV